MKRKYLSRTYLNNAKKYKLKFDFSNDEYIVCIKTFIDVENFIAKEGHKLISNGYYMIEIIPNNENYMMRVYLDDNMIPLEYYFDIIAGKGIDENTKVPYYDDLYLDVVISKTGLELYDMNELNIAHKDGLVNDKLYELATNTANNLMNEIKEGKNRYRNMDLKQFID